MIFRGLVVVMIGLVCFWGLPGCGEEKPEVVQEEIVTPEPEEAEVKEDVEEEIAESEEESGEEAPSGNTAPTITSAKIMPFPAQTDTDLRVEVEAEDPDGDWINYAYQWVIVRAGDTLEDLEELEDQTAEILSHELFSRDDAVAVKITPSDWYAEGEPFKTKLVVIANSPPEIISSPTGASAELYEYQVKAEDSDKDTMTYKLGAESPSGMSIDAATGLLTWDTSKADRGAHEITIHVHDGHGGNSFQRFTLTLTEEAGTEEGKNVEEVEDTEIVEETEDVEEYGEVEQTKDGQQPEEFQEFEEPEETDAW